MATKYKVTVPEGGARHALPGGGLITIRENMADVHIEALMEAGVTQYFTEIPADVQPLNAETDVQIDQTGTDAGTDAAATRRAKRA
ncbi:hypothetical protein GVN20_24720 [Runella sp. CRIBMP]|uniref:hypothetical protein n=1 Tax=Runella sp. CRIBMP TaxID=2683261 RepID=UPI0014135E7E|nr:hypothetical protein [Runella sp. CRIBMP]NBB22581.1 hypothetical protein [Runella sp. CRIBMP]